MPIDEQIYKTALSDGMPDNIARFLVGQARHESGNFLSKFAIKYNSVFGYSYNPFSKWQKKVSGSLADNKWPIANYATIEDSTHELTSWIKRRQKDGKFPKDLTTISTPMDYAKLLQNCGYFQGWKKYTKEQNLKFYADGIAKGMYTK